MSFSRRGFLKLAGASLLGAFWLPRSARAAEPLVRGLYFPAFKLASPQSIAQFKDTVRRSGANAVVMDIKTEGGIVHIPFDHPLKPPRDPLYTYPRQLFELLQWCQSRGIRPVARQVVFNDTWLASYHVGHALLDYGGRIWRDTNGDGFAYTDPFSEAVHDYNAAVAVAAGQMGFAEVQFDYVRFPAGYVGNIAFRKPWTFENRTAAITGFVEMAAQQVRAAGAAVSVDVFGATAWAEQRDAGIGQYLESLAPHLDALCPMAYPSTYGTGIPDCPNACRPAPAYPREIVYHTTRQARRRVLRVAPQVSVIPWIQAFGDYRYYLPFGVQQIWDQQRGALAAGARGVYCWEPGGRYPDDVFHSPAAGVSAEVLGSIR